MVIKANSAKINQQFFLFPEQGVNTSLYMTGIILNHKRMNFVATDSFEKITLWWPILKKREREREKMVILLCLRSQFESHSALCCPQTSISLHQNQHNWIKPQHLVLRCNKLKERLDIKLLTGIPLDLPVSFHASAVAKLLVSLAQSQILRWPAHKVDVRVIFWWLDGRRALMQVR